MLLLVLLSTPQEREPLRVAEYDLKAAFLYNFATFVEWPPTSFADPAAPFVVGVLGKDPFGDLLEQAFRGKTVGGRPIAVKRSMEVADLKACHLVFLPAVEGENSAKALAALKGVSVLTVGERQGFAEGGGCVNFYIGGKRIRFEINPEAAKRANLKVSSKLLRLARVVSDKE